MDAMTVGSAKALAGEGIRVNAVRPADLYRYAHWVVNLNGLND